MTPRDRERADEDQRRRVLGGLAAALAARGYGATTIADVVREAGVSRSTFYAHFADKEEAFLALYSRGADQVLDVLERENARASAAELGWHERVEVVASAYFRSLAAGGAVTRALLAEISAVSDRSRALRRQVLDRYVDLLGRMAEEVAEQHPGLRAPSRALLLAGVGGMNELMLRAVEAGDDPRLENLTAAATELVVAIMRDPSEGAGGAPPAGRQPPASR